MNTTSPTTPPSPPPAPARAPILFPGALLVFALAAAYANSLGAPFVYDDGPAITDHLTIWRLWPLTDVLLPQAEGGLTASGRPVLNLSFALNYALSGPAVWRYHAVNALTQAASARQLFGRVRRTLLSPGWRAQFGEAAVGLALNIAAVWSLHPLQTQAVTYTVRRAESLMGFFYLLTLYAFARGTEAAAAADARRRWFGLSVVACALGMGTKEVMATAPLLVCP